MPTETENRLIRKATQIKELRKLSLVDIANQTGIAKPSLSRFFKGQNGLTWENMERLCHLLGIRQIELAEPPPELISEEAPPDSMEIMVAKHVAKTLAQTGWNIKRTAEYLGLSRLAIYNHIKRFKIPVPEGRNIRVPGDKK